MKHCVLGSIGLRVMVGNCAIKTATGIGVSLGMEDDKTKDDIGSWRSPDTINTTCNIAVSSFRPFRHLLGDNENRYDVVIEKSIGKLPRKTKKAMLNANKRMGKRKFKLQNYLASRKVILPNAKVVLQ